MARRQTLNKDEALSRHEIEERAARAWADWYWAKRLGKPPEDRIAAIRAYRFYRAWSRSGPFTIERNAQGNRAYRNTDADRQLGIPAQAERYGYDFREGWGSVWQQYDTWQDASFFGVWVDVKGMRIFTFAEGDRSLVECDSSKDFAAELGHMARFYGDPPAAFISVGADGRVTQHFDSRPSTATA